MIRGAASHQAAAGHGRNTHHAAAGHSKGRHTRLAKSGGISCVPYAREVSGIGLKGNAATWWDEASGVYARGNTPESGSVLNFRANNSMRLGHVAVVAKVVGAREVLVDHANWWGPSLRGGISRGVPVVDVSANNDWTAVRVGLGKSGQFGSIYPTYGFIYDRPDNGTAVAARSGSGKTVLASAGGARLPLVLNPAPRDLRPAGQRTPLATTASYDEVAEAPVHRGIDLSIGGLATDAPDRRLR